MAKMIKALWPPVMIAFIGLILAFSGFSAAGLLVYILGIMDFNGRSKDYNYLRKFRYMNVRMLDVYGTSYCSRNVVITLFPIYQNYYRSGGYKWWHILPDGFPKCLISRAFWHSVALGHRY